MHLLGGHPVLSQNMHLLGGTLYLIDGLNSFCKIPKAAPYLTLRGLCQASEVGFTFTLKELNCQIFEVAIKRKISKIG